MRRRGLGLHLEDSSAPRYSSSEGVRSASSPPLSSDRSTPQDLTPVESVSAATLGLPRPSRNRGAHRARHNAPPKPREGWQRSLCEQVVINYPSALPSKDAFVKRKVP